MELKDILLARKLSGIPQPTVADVGKTPVVDENGKYQLVDLGVGISYEVVSQLPSEGEAGVIYLIANGAQSGTNIYDEYIWTGSGYEKIGSTETPNNVYILTLPYSNDTDANKQLNAAFIETKETEIEAAYSSEKVIIIIEPSSTLSKEYYIVGYININTDYNMFDIDAIGVRSHNNLSWLIYGHNSTDPFSPFLTKTVRKIAEASSVPKAREENIGNFTNYWRVVRQTGTEDNGYLFVPKSGTMPDIPNTATHHVLSVNEISGELVADWNDAQSPVKTISSGTIYTIVMGAVMTAISGTGEATWGESSNAYYAVVQMFLASFGGRNSYTNESPYIKIGDYSGKLILMGDTTAIANLYGYESTSGYFVKISFIFSVDNDQEIGTASIHAEAYQASAFPQS